MLPLLEYEESFIYGGFILIMPVISEIKQFFLNILLDKNFWPLRFN
jgi:hypothetical protein